MSGLFLVLIRCRRCGGRNGVDIRKTGLRKRARCGRCGEPLPRRLPAPLLVAAGALVVGLLAGSFMALGALDMRREQGARERVETLLAEGRQADAIAHLPSPRASSSEAGQVARRLAEQMARPVTDVAADPHASDAAIATALAEADVLTELHRKTLPELVEVIDASVQRLAAKQAASDIMAGAEALARSSAPDPDRVEAALAEATLQTVGTSPALLAAVEERSRSVRSRAALARARSLAVRRPQDARAVLDRAAARLPTLAADEPQEPAEPPAAIEALSLSEQVRAVREAVRARDRLRLRELVLLRPPADWSEAAARELSTEMQAACGALASLESDEARRTWEPGERAEHLLAAMTCDELLPADFLASAQLALADARLESARRGAAIAPALLAWSSQSAGARRDRALASVGCLAIARDDQPLALRAFALIEGPSSLALMASCRDEAADPPASVDAPELDYPATDAASPAVSAPDASAPDPQRR